MSQREFVSDDRAAQESVAFIFSLAIVSVFVIIALPVGSMAFTQAQDTAQREALEVSGQSLAMTVEASIS